MQKILWGLLVFPFMACMEKDNCGGPGGEAIEQARMYCYLDETLPYMDHPTFLYMQEGVLLAYPDVVNGKFALPADREKIRFRVYNNNLLIDTLTIRYRVDTGYYEGEPCNETILIPKASNVHCYSTGHWFEVAGFH